MVVVPHFFCTQNSTKNFFQNCFAQEYFRDAVIISALIVMLLIMVLEMVSMNPFNQAWVVLKMTMEESRQTELGEYHPKVAFSLLEAI